MRVICFILLLTTLVFSTVDSNLESDEKFKNGNTLYELGKYDSAITVYNKVLVKKKSAELYYNIGNCHYRLENWGEALLEYNRALIYSPRDKDILYNIEIAQSHTVDKVDNEKERLAIKIIKYAHNILSLKSKLVLIIVMSFLFTLFLYRTLFRKGNKRNWAIYGIVVILFLLTPMIFTAVVSIKSLKKSYGIVLVDKAKALNSPNGKKTLFTVHEGSKFKVIRESDGWFFVIINSGVSGWINGEEVGIIK